MSECLRSVIALLLVLIAGTSASGTLSAEPAEEGWVLHAVNVWPKGGERKEDYHGVNLDWRSSMAQKVEIDPERGGESRMRLDKRYLDDKTEKLLAHYFYEAIIEAPPEQIRGGERVPVAARGRRVTKGHFADHNEYTSWFKISFHGRGGTTTTYIPGDQAREVEMPDGTDDVRLEVEFKAPTLAEVRQSAKFKEQTYKKEVVPEIRFVATAGIYGGADLMTIEWKYRIGEVEAPGPEIIALDAFDANPLSWGEHDWIGDSPKPSALILAEDTRAGTSADGASALILRAEVTDEVPVVFHVLGEESGELEPLFDSRTLTLQESHFAFARYWPPEELPGQGTGESSSLAKPKRRFGGENGPESVLLEIQAVPYRPTSAGNAEAYPKGSEIAELELVRPPVVLVHGLFSNALQCWSGVWGEGKSLTVLLQKAGFVPFHVNYPRSNGGGRELFRPQDLRPSDFASNWNVVWRSPDEDHAVERQIGWMQGRQTGWLGIEEQPILSEYQRAEDFRLGGIEEALRYYREELDVAATQADVVGHSMGGLLPRVYASKAFNENYERPENFDKGDINRLVTINTPHFGSDLADLVRLLRPAVIGEESLAEWTQRFVALGLFRGLFASANNGALLDLNAKSENLGKIGATGVPSFAIATYANHGQLGKNEHDPGQAYLMAYSGIGMLFFFNPNVLQAAVEQRAREWRDAGSWQRSTAQDGRGAGAGSVGTYGEVDFSTDEGVARYTRLVHAGFDESVYYWSRYREAEFREDLRRRIEGTVLVRFGIFDAFEGEGWSPSPGGLAEDLKALLSYLVVGGNVFRASSADVEPDIPHEVVDGIRSLVFHGDAQNDGAVRVESQLGGLPESSTLTFDGIIHSFSPWDYRVQREVIRTLRWGNERFAEEGFPETAQPMPHWLPSAGLAESRVYGELGVAWSGMVQSHAEAYLSVADSEDRVVIARPVNQDSTALIAGGASTKGMAIKGKSSNWGPQRGLLAVDQKFSKIWRTKTGAARAADIAEYNGINHEVLGDLESPPRPLLYPADPEAPELEGRPFAVARALLVEVAGREYEVLIDPDEEDAEEAVFLHADGELFDWRTGREERDGSSVPIFDRDVAPTRTIDEPRKSSVLATRTPMMVLADGLSEVNPKPYLTADYDLLAIGIRRSDGFHGVPPHVESAEYHELRGYISPPQLDLVRKLNGAVHDQTDYRAGNLTHHGPEVQYAKSPYVDYPLLVFDPKSPEDGDGEMFIVRQGPVGFRDIHLKRFFGEKIRDGFNLWPNPVSKGWSWESYRPYTPERGYDVRDAPDLKEYVAEQRRPKGFPARRAEDVGGDSPEPDPAVTTSVEPEVETQPDPKPDLIAATMEELEAYAAAGNSAALNQIGFRYAKGQGVPKDEDKARDCYRRAAEAGNSAAQANYGRRFYSGIGVEQNYAEAYKWYLKSAEQGHGAALSTIGYMYEKGLHVGEDLKTAISWYEKGLAKDDRGALNRMGVLSRSGKGVPRDYGRAVELFHRCALQGDSFAQEQLALMHYQGQGTQVDKIEAYAWLNLSAAGGDETAAERRDLVEKELDARQLKLAQQRSSELRAEVEGD